MGARMTAPVVSAIVIAVLMTASWAVSVVWRTASIVDVVWGFGLVLVTGVAPVATGGSGLRARSADGDDGDLGAAIRDSPDYPQQGYGRGLADPEASIERSRALPCVARRFQ